MSKSFLPSGFSLLEVLLVMGLFSLLAVAAVPVFRNLILENDLATSQFLTVQAAREAAAAAAAGRSDSGWGINASKSSITIFQGTNFATRLVSSDKIYSFPPSVSVATPIEIDFAEGSGQPSAGAAIVLTSISGQSDTVSIDRSGLVSD